MFSKIPMPQANWNKENMKYMFVFFPWIGIVIGGLTMLAAYLGDFFGYDRLHSSYAAFGGIRSCAAQKGEHL